MKKFIKTRYVGALVSNNELVPIKVGNCPIPIFKAAPVTNALMAGKGIKSTMNPNRSKPIKKTITPATMAIAAATCIPSYSGFVTAMDIRTRLEGRSQIRRTTRRTL